MDVQQDKKDYTLIHVKVPNEKILDIDDVLIQNAEYKIEREMYKPENNTLKIYKFMKDVIKGPELQKPIITLSGDTSVSSSNISGLSEKFMCSDSKNINGTERILYDSKLRVIYFSADVSLFQKSYVEYKNFSNSILSNALGLTKESFTEHNVNLNPKNLFIIGANKKLVSDEEEHIIKENGINYFDLETIRKKGINNIIQYVVNEIGEYPVHIVFNLSCLNTKVAPSVFRKIINDGKEIIYDGFNIDEFDLILNGLKEIYNLHSLDITSYYFGQIKDKQKYYSPNYLTTHIIKKIMKNFANIKEKSINIFDDESKFLIWKQIDDDDKIGWYILRGVSLEVKEKLLQQIDDKITTITIEIDGKPVDALVSSTSIAEQQEKSYYMTNNTYDCCLYPDEKIDMVFELLNTY
jgi:arginase family enzyme